MGFMAKSDGVVSGPQPTDDLLRFAQDLDWAGVPQEARHAARRHLLDTVGAMVAGAQGSVTAHVEEVLGAVRQSGSIPVPGRVRRADLLDAAFLGGVSAHGIELDDGYREGAVHPGAPIVSAILPLAYHRRVRGTVLLTAMLAGYETALATARACHPALRRRGFHPTATIGALGAAVAASKLLGLTMETATWALGLAGSSAAGLHAYVNGGADVKRLHGGHAAREGLQAALLAQAGIAGPPMVLEGKDGFFQAFTSGVGIRMPEVELGADDGFLINRCYVKPFACCRHLQPAAEAVISLVNENGIDAGDIQEIIVETYHLAGEMAEVGWDDFASAQLSFPFIMAAAATYRDIRLEHFEPSVLADPEIAKLCGKVRVVVTDEMEELYPRLRPSKAIIVTGSGRFVLQVDEATGAPEMPLSDEGLKRKFIDLVTPVLGADRAQSTLERFWAIDKEADMSALLAMLVP